MKWIACFLCVCTLAAGARPLPYKEAGLTERQAAAFMLQRLTFGPQPGEVDRVAADGLENWLEEQLRGNLPEAELSQKLAVFPALQLTAGEIRQDYLPRQRLVELAERHGLARVNDADAQERERYERLLREFKQSHEIATYDDLQEQVRGQKLVRARYAQNQLREMLTDFWFNHFNVAALSDPVRLALLPYERDVLRPAALGRFESMLQASARHPAMLYYLNNNVSSAAPERATTLNARIRAATPEEQARLKQGQPLKRKSGGLNENYAREVMELHTLGVDGGYTQEDVTELARIFSGWTVLYPEADQPRLRDLIAPGAVLGYLWQDDFLFRADWHDSEGKVLLGHRFEAGGGAEEGERALHILACHPSTARYVCRKLAQRFVCDEPSAALVERLSATFVATSGDVSAVVRELVHSPEFWSEARRPTKLKSPFQFFVSCLRVTGADYEYDGNHFYWLRRLGEPIYQCGPPTGFPEDSREWATTSSVVQRVNWTNLLVQNRLPKIRVQLPAVAAEPVIPLARQFLPERAVTGLVEPFSAKTVALPGDGYAAERLWFKPRRPADFQQRKERAIALRVAALLLASPEFQFR